MLVRRFDTKLSKARVVEHRLILPVGTDASRRGAYGGIVDLTAQRREEVAQMSWIGEGRRAGAHSTTLTERAAVGGLPAGGAFVARPPSMSSVIWPPLTYGVTTLNGFSYARAVPKR